MLANIEENRKEDMEGIADLPFVQYPRTVDETAAEVRNLGRLTGRVAAAAGPPADREAKAGISRVAPVSRPLCLPDLAGSLLASGETVTSGTSCGPAAITFAGRRERYFAIGVEDLDRAKPDVILLPSEPFPFSEKHLADFADLIEVPAVASGRVLLADGKLLSWHGVRTAPGLALAWSLLHGLPRNRAKNSTG